jgi:hypothetical protein
MAGFFSFHQLVSNTIIKTVYVIGLLVLTVLGLSQIGFGIYGLFQQQSMSSPTGVPLLLAQPAGAIASGLLVLIPGNLIWRLICEAWILVFSMHEMMASIERSLAKPQSVAYERTVT